MTKKEIIGLCEFLKIHHFENAYVLFDYFEEKNKEIDRLNNIISEIEKYLINLINNDGISIEATEVYEDVFDKLNELKEKE